MLSLYCSLEHSTLLEDAAQCATASSYVFAEAQPGR